MNKWTTKLREFFGLAQQNLAGVSGKLMNASRQDFICMAINGLIESRSVQFTEIASKMDSKAESLSNLRRIQRFISDYDLDFKYLAKFLLCMLPKRGKVKISLDRTNWQFGKTWQNILVISVYSHGVGIPIWFEILEDHESGNSNSDERIYIMLELLTIIPKERISSIVADREFASKEWIEFLLKEKLAFYLRIKDNHVIEYKGQKVKLKTLLHGRYKLIIENVEIFGASLSMSIKKSKKLKKNGQVDWIIVVTNDKVTQALTEYKLRWSIEVMFQAFKNRGFRLEDTHVKEPVRLRKLIMLVALAFTICFVVGLEQHKAEKAIEIKNHGYKANSFFRYGLETIRRFMKKNIDVSKLIGEITKAFLDRLIFYEKIVM
jgi:hypothetical protein